MTEQQPTTPEPSLDHAPVRRSSLFARTALLLVIIALLTLAWQWLNTRHRFNQVEQSLSERLEQLKETSQQSLALARNADERSVETAARAAQLEQRLAESQDQQEALQTLYMELANNREERLISEVEQLLIIANQQLQLVGNLKSALIALQTADGRLQQLDTPQVIQLRKQVAQDLQRLQSLPTVDIVGMSLKLANLAESIDSLPLVSERHPTSSPPPQPEWQHSPLRRFAQELWHDLKQMVRLERVDRPEPPLLAPDQTFFLRENIKLRLLTARIALLQHDEATYRSDLSAAEKWLNSHFDQREPVTKSALRTIAQLSASDITIQLPDISESLALVSKYKLTLERKSNTTNVSVERKR
jgi:uroporphyrin-III C-methyltransferase